MYISINNFIQAKLIPAGLSDADTCVPASFVVRRFACLVEMLFSCTGFAAIGTDATAVITGRQAALMDRVTDGLSNKTALSWSLWGRVVRCAVNDGCKR